jgi:Trk-type K+ transport system membrane component
MPGWNNEPVTVSLLADDMFTVASAATNQGLSINYQTTAEDFSVECWRTYRVKKRSPLP